MIFVIDLTMALAKFCFGGVAGHYVQVEQAARLLCTTQDPYGLNFPGGSGWYFFSPTYALFFSAPFAYLPSRIGQALNNLTSVSIFLLGLYLIFGAVKKQSGINLRTTPLRHIFWLFLGSEIIGAVLSIKLEIAIVGMVLVALSLLITKRREWVAFALLALVTNWKIQPAAISGLALLTLTLKDRTWKPVFWYGAFLLLFSALPLVFLPTEFLIKVSEHWFQSLNQYVMEASLKSGSFHHIWLFLQHGLGLPVTEAWFSPLSLFAGLVFGGSVIWFFTEQTNTRTDLLVFAVALGSAFPSVFSPLSQGTAYILSVPIFFSIPYFQLRKNAVSAKKILIPYFCSFFLISLAYSDLVPKAARKWFWYMGAKPLGMMILIGLLLSITLPPFLKGRVTILRKATEA